MRAEEKEREERREEEANAVLSFTKHFLFCLTLWEALKLYLCMIHIMYYNLYDQQMKKGEVKDERSLNMLYLWYTIVKSKIILHV